MDSKIIAKIKYNEDTRRASIDLPLEIKNLFGILQELFPSLLTNQFVVKYVDEDSDYITVSSNLELGEALRVASKQNNVLRLFVFGKSFSHSQKQTCTTHILSTNEHSMLHMTLQ